VGAIGGGGAPEGKPPTVDGYMEDSSGLEKQKGLKKQQADSIQKAEDAQERGGIVTIVKERGKRANKGRLACSS